MKFMDILFNQHDDAIITNTIKSSRGQSSYIYFLQTMAIQLSPIEKLNLSNFTFDIGLLYSENLSQAVCVAFDSENSFDNFEETFGTNFNTMPSFS
jgi:hypothetical protein